MYGAGTGGLILVNSFDRWQPGASLEYLTGSYNLQNFLPPQDLGPGKIKINLPMHITKAMVTEYKQKCDGITSPGNPC